jgi:hypothetical protein
MNRIARLRQETLFDAFVDGHAEAGWTAGKVLSCAAVAMGKRSWLA